MGMEGEVTCARLEVEGSDKVGDVRVVYVKGRWYPSRFSLSISDGYDAWECTASEEEISRKADGWDYTVSEYVEQCQLHLSRQQPNSKYSFATVADHARKLSWTLEKNGVQLAAHWKVSKSANSRAITTEILDFLMSEGIKLSEEVLRKTRGFERMREEAAKCRAQMEKYKNAKMEFEEDAYKKFVAVLNAKKAKIRELRETVLQSGNTLVVDRGKDPSIEKTDSDNDDDDESDEDEDMGIDRDVKSRNSAEGQDSPLTDDSSKPRILADEPSACPALAAETENVRSTSVHMSGTETTKAVGPSAENLLSGPKYTSAPRKRRNIK